MTKLITYICVFFGLSQLYAQELRLAPMPLTMETSNEIEFSSNAFESPNTAISIAQIVDTFTVQLVGYGKENISIGLNGRLEEELPYDDAIYVYSGFYYLDLGINYAVNDFNFGCVIENILNFGNDNFSIDPILETSNSLIDAFYFSHETDTLLTFTIVYRF